MAKLVHYAEFAYKYKNRYINSIKGYTFKNKSVRDEILDNFDWFIFQDGNGNFLTVPVWSLSWNISNLNCSIREQHRIKDKNGNSRIHPDNAKTRPAVWVIPSFENIGLKSAPKFPISMCEHPIMVETNDYIKNFSLPKELEKYGYKFYAMVYGVEIEKKYPTLNKLNVEKLKSADTLAKASWLVAEAYSEEVKRQYIEDAEKKASLNIRN